MRHQWDHRKFGRSSSHRRALLRNMATSLLLHERCRTTVEKAKDLKRVTEKLITLAKRGGLHARRQAYAYVLNKSVVHKLFADLGPRFKNRKGGYLRIVRTDYRHGDAAEMAYIEFVEGPKKVEAQASSPGKDAGKAKAKSGKSAVSTEAATAGGEKGSAEAKKSKKAPTKKGK